MYSPNGMMKLKAKQALQNNWQVALLVCFVASLPGIIGQVVSILTGGDFATRLAQGMNIMLGELSTGMIPSDLEQYLMTTLTAQFDQTFVISAVVSLVMAVITPVLMLGMWKYLFGLLRGQSGELTDVFSRIGLFFKAIGLDLLVALKIVLWGLPGVALLYGGSWLSATILAGMESATVETALSMFSVLTNASYIAIFVPVIMATFRYAMAVYHLADNPAARLRDCVAESKELMKHRKMSLFSLQLSFIGWHLLISLINMLLQSMFGYVIGATVQMFLTLALTLYMETSICCFYLVAKNPEQVGFRRVQIPFPQPEKPDDGDDNQLN